VNDIGYALTNGTTPISKLLNDVGYALTGAKTNVSTFINDVPYATTAQLTAATSSSSASAPTMVQLTLSSGWVKNGNKPREYYVDKSTGRVNLSGVFGYTGNSNGNTTGTVIPAGQLPAPKYAQYLTASSGLASGTYVPNVLCVGTDGSLALDNSAQEIYVDGLSYLPGY